MRVLVTGSNGFIAKNLLTHLDRYSGCKVACFNRDNDPDELGELVRNADFVFHLAGVNRPDDDSEFERGNACLTELLCDAIAESGRSVPVVYSSSIQALSDNPYGRSKLKAEEVLLASSRASGFPAIIYRLPNVFGKWSRPNYNSVVATFCHRISRSEPIVVNDPQAALNLVYIDDVIDEFLSLLEGDSPSGDFGEVNPVYATTVGELADLIKAFRDSRDTLVTEPVGSGFTRALYSTYLSYLEPVNFDYELPRYADDRGVFVEMLKTRDSGQFSFFTSHPGVTRGGHYHHSKNEKFLVLKGRASFRFRHLITGKFYELTTSSEESRVVETVPGWTHDITNIGTDELVVMLWANEVFDRDKPDTYHCPIDKGE